MNVLYSGFYYDNLWKIAKHLEKKYDWKPVYWFGNESSKASIEKEFPNIIFQDYLKARRATHTNIYKEITPTAIDKEIIDNLSLNQNYAMKILYRCDPDGKNFTLQDLTNHYYLMLQFWLTIINESKIELVIFWTNPHGCEYILYLLCKLLKIPVLYLDCAYCITNDNHLICSSIEDKTELLLKKYSDSNISYSPKKSTIERINEQKSSYTLGQPDYMSEKDLWISKKISLKEIYHSTREVISIIIRGPFTKVYDHMKYRPGRYEIIEDTCGNKLQHFLHRKNAVKNRKKHKTIYNKLISPIDLSKNYIYFAAPFQPEGTTLPDAGAYEELIIVLKLLSQYLPKNWFIVYKEHPAIFDSTIGGNDIYRSKDFYERISKIKNIKFIDYRVDTFHLIDNSKAIATVSGTVGWEAVVRGKPSITFGETWYNPCEGIFPIINHTDLKTAFEKIENGYLPDFDKIIRFAGVIDTFCSKDIKFRNFQTRQKNIDNIDLEMERYAEYFHSAYLEYYTS